MMILHGSWLSGAAFSEDERYRYGLWRSLGPLPALDGPPRRVLWVMLNPSTADATDDDNTIRACKRISAHLGFSYLEVGNLYAWRSRDPKALRRVDDPVGPENLAHLRTMADQAERVICAWGTHAEPKRAELVAGMLSRGRALWCLGHNVHGQPKHPLFLRTDTPLVLYVPGWGPAP
jgi:hypothetical protein